MTPKQKNHEQGIIEGELGLLPIHRWFFNQDFKNVNYYNQSVFLEMKRPVGSIPLEEAFTKIIQHHDGLRLNYNLIHNSLFFNNEHLTRDFKVETFLLNHLSLEEKEAELRSIGEEFKGSFDITKDLLIKAAIVQYSHQKQYLLITFHHILVDGVSWRIILEDLYHSLSSLLEGEEIRLPLKTASLQDWYQGLMDYSNTSYVNERLNYWNGLRLEEFTLPRDFENQDWSIKESETITLELTKEETDHLITNANKSYNTQVNDLLLVAITRAIKNWTGNNRSLIEMEDPGRYLEDVEVSRTVGCLTALYPIELLLSKSEVGDQIKEIKEQLRSRANKAIEYGMLKYMKNAPNQKGSEISEVRFNYLGRLDDEVENDLFVYDFKDTGAETCDTNRMTTKIDINCMIAKGRLKIDFTFNKNAHKKENIVTFANDFLKQLKKTLQHTMNSEEIQFTPSDFETIDIDQEDLDSLIG